MVVRVKISQLPAAGTLSGTEAVPVVQSGGTKQATANQLARPAALRALPGKAIEDEFAQYLNYLGTADMSPVINDCIATYTAQGNPVMIGPGNYLNNSSLLLINDAQILASKRATFIRNFSTLGVGGHITQANFATPIERVSWQGGIIKNPSPTTLTGNAFSVNVNSSQFSDFFVDEWEGRAMLLFGEKNRVHNFKAYSNITPGGGAIRLDRAENTLVSNGDVRCDDDCYMWNLPAQGAFAGGINRYNQYVNCYGESISGRLLIAACARSSVEPTVTGEIYGNEAVGMTGRCRLGVSIINTLATGDIYDIGISNLNVDLSPAVSGNAFGGIEIIAGRLGYPEVGGVRDIDFVAPIIKSPFGHSVRIRGRAEGIRFHGGHLEASRTANRTTVEISNSISEDAGFSSVSFTGTHIEGRADADLVRVGSDNLEQIRVFFRGVHFDNIGASRRGINVISAAAGGIEMCRFTEASGVINARAFNVGSAVNNFHVGQNLYELTTAIDVTWGASHTSGSTWNARAVVPISANFTARAHMCGTTFIATAAGLRTLTLSPPDSQMTFTVVQAGTGPIRVQALAGDTIKLGTGSTTSGGYIESAAVGSSVTLVAVDADTWIASSYNGTWTLT